MSIGPLPHIGRPISSEFFKVYNPETTEKFLLLLLLLHPYLQARVMLLTRNSVMEGIQWYAGNY